MKRGFAAVASCLTLSLAAGATTIGVAPAADTEKPFHRAELVFPLDYLHNHASCVVECPNGDLLVCWYRGSGERSADDVRILGARKRAGATNWSAPFVMADVPGFPDCNPAMVIDPQQRLWLFWPTILANEWHTALLRYVVSRDYQRAEGPPVWYQEKVLHLKPGEEFPRAVNEATEQDSKRLAAAAPEAQERYRTYMERRQKNAADKYFNRMGWMPRAHAYILDGRRLIVPLYSDGFSFSLMAITDDWGENWKASAPLVAFGNVQPSIARKRDGALATYMRDNGPAPKRLLYSESRDRGETWSPVRDTDLPNPGSGAEVIGLRDGRWALIYNDTERGRHSLAVSISDDEGKSWRWTRHLELDTAAEDRGSFSYPSILQAADGSLHATYTFQTRAADARRDAEGRTLQKSIKHAHFNAAWVMAGN
jgi:predicted neuraminidase